MVNTISVKKALALGLALLGAVTLLIVFAAMPLRSGGNEALAGSAGTVDFSAHIAASATNGGDCDSSGVPTNSCRIAAGTTFIMGVGLNEIGNALPGGNYSGYDAHLDYTGVTSAETHASVDAHQWPACVKAADSFQPGTVFAGCAVGVGQPDSAYEGLLVTVEFTCTASGTVTLVHGAYVTALYDDGSSSSFHEDEGTTESLNIECAAPQPYPGDSDGDACPDAREQQTASGSVITGGRRNFLNTYDYFNPTHDGKNRIDDVLAVLDQYFVDSGNPAYTTNTDRTLMGPNAWNLGPPDGKQRVDDILNAVHQYYQDCS